MASVWIVEDRLLGTNDWHILGVAMVSRPKTIPPQAAGSQEEAQLYIRNWTRVKRDYRVREYRRVEEGQ